MTTTQLPSFWSDHSIATTQRFAHALRDFQPPRKAERILICPPTTPGSIGDEAMLQALIHQLRDRGYTVDVLVISLDEDWSDLEDVSAFVELPRFVAYQSYLSQFNQYTHFYLIGADCLDGFYDVTTSQWLLWLCYCASLVCNEVTIVGFSFNTSPAPELKVPFDMLNRDNIRINNRDPLSYERFKQFSSTPNHLVADAAFMLRPIDPAGDSTQRRTFGLNVSPHSLMSHASFSDIIDHFISELRQVLTDHPDVDVLLIPHDFRGDTSDAAMLAAIVKKLDAKRVTLATYNGHPAREIKGLVKGLDFVVSGRMHLAIACLGSGTPAVSVAYQDKFEGLLQHFSLSPDKLLIGPEDILQKGALSSLVSSMLASSAGLRQQITDRLPYILGLSEQNLK